ncbi:MAG: hypothetical protein U0168_14715 [Nannocystaceae bacterium]
MRFSILFLIVSVAAPLGCGGQSGAQPSVEESIAKAVQLESKDQKAREQIEASHRAAKDEARKQEEAVVAARDAEIDAAAALPSPLPADVAAACDAVVAAYDDFMKRGPERDALEWFEGRRKKMGERRAACVSQGNVAVAACQGRALMAPLPSLAELPRLDAAALVTTRCADKFGANAGKPGL